MAIAFWVARSAKALRPRWSSIRCCTPMCWWTIRPPRSMPWARRARASRPRRGVGVTGSAGKTSVKEALFAALDRGSRGRAHRSVKSYNNHVGVPLSLARMPARTQFGVFEMGMNHAGAFRAHPPGAPACGHRHHHRPGPYRPFQRRRALPTPRPKSLKGWSRAGWRSSRPTAAITSACAPRRRLMPARWSSFGRAAHADVRLLDVVPAPGGGSLVTADLGDRKLCYTVAQPGDHWVINSLAVMAAVRAVGGDLGAAGLALAEMEGLAGRGARHQVHAQDGDGSGMRC
jgi:UDP-N-acetylmuramoyl-tripeptide--D-alanyl-D-alanine ligase